GHDARRGELHRRQSSGGRPPLRARDRGQFHGRQSGRSRSRQCRLLGGHLQEDQGLGRDREEDQSSGRTGPDAFTFDDVLEGQAKEDQGRRRKGEGADEADRPTRGRGGQEGAAHHEEKVGREQARSKEQGARSLYQIWYNSELAFARFSLLTSCSYFFGVAGFVATAVGAGVGLTAAAAFSKED